MTLLLMTLAALGLTFGKTPGRIKQLKLKDSPIYEQLCTIFTESGVDGKYAQSSHYEEFLNKSIVTDAAAYTDNGTPISETPSSSRFMQGKASCSEKVANRDVQARGKKRPLEVQSSFNQSSRNRGIGDVIAEAMLEMVSAYKSTSVATTQSDSRYSISNCIKALDEIEIIDEHVYFFALDLFEEPNPREMFISLNGNGKRLAWLHDKYSNSISIGV